MTFRSGRFTLAWIGAADERSYVTSWDTWEEAAAAFNEMGRMPYGYALYDNETGRVWRPGARYLWEEAQT